MRSGSGGSAGGGGRSAGGASGTGTKAAVAGTIGAASAAKTVAKAPASAAAVAKTTVAPVAAKPKGLLSSLAAAEAANSGYSTQAQVRELAGGLKSAADFGKQNAFDREALSLAREGKLTLSYHDYPSSLSKERLASMVYDPTGDFTAHGAKGTWFATMVKR